MRVSKHSFNSFIDYATTNIDLKEGTSHQSPIRGSDEDYNLNTVDEDQNKEQPMIDEPKTNAAIEPGKYNQKSSKGLKIDALYFLNKFNNLLKEYLGGAKSFVGSSKEIEFDIDEFHARVMSDKQFELNKTWSSDYFIMSCPAKSYIERFCVQGEFF